MAILHLLLRQFGLGGTNTEATVTERTSILAVCALFIILSWASLGWSLWTRARITRSLASDDILMSLATVSIAC
jgi:hypothetical protein